MYYLVYLNGFCNGNKGGHALDTSATPQQTQNIKLNNNNNKKKARSISRLLSFATTPYNLSQFQFIY